MKKLNDLSPSITVDCFKKYEAKRVNYCKEKRQRLKLGILINEVGKRSLDLKVNEVLDKISLKYSEF